MTTLEIVIGDVLQNVKRPFNNYRPIMKYPGLDFLQDSSAITNLILDIQKVTIMQVIINPYEKHKDNGD